MNTRTFFTAILLLTITNPAMAHTGDHSTVAVSEIVGHMLQSPVHIGLIAAVIAIAVGLAGFFAVRKQNR